MEITELAQKVETMGIQIKEIKEHLSDVGFVQNNDGSMLAKTIDRIDRLELKMEAEFRQVNKILQEILAKLS